MMYLVLGLHAGAVVYVLLINYVQQMSNVAALAMLAG